MSAARIVITITTIYPGASAELIQGFITAPISSVVSTTENVNYVTSQSRPSTSVVTLAPTATTVRSFIDPARLE